jgi:LETM1-like protein
MVAATAVLEHIHQVILVFQYTSLEVRLHTYLRPFNFWAGKIYLMMLSLMTVFNISGSISSRGIHCSSVLLEKEPSKPSSKVEATVQTLKNAMNEKKPVADPDLAPVVAKKSMWQKVKDELIHYYHGFRLLFIDINVSRKLVMRVLNGKSLTRREHRQVTRLFIDSNLVSDT